MGADERREANERDERSKMRETRHERGEGGREVAYPVCERIGACKAGHVRSYVPACVAGFVLPAGAADGAPGGSGGSGCVPSDAPPCAEPSACSTFEPR